MLNIKNVLPITLIIFASIGLISFFTISHIQSLRKLNQNANEVSFSYYDEEERKSAIEEEIKLSKFHKAMQAHTIRHLTLSELEKEGLEGSSRDFRSLAESNLFDDVAIVDPNKDSFYYTTRWITQKLKQFSSSIVVYPYSYEYSPDDSPNSTVSFTQGSYIALDPSELNAYNIGLKTNKTLSIQKARALFGADVAILSVLGKFEDDDTIDYFYDGTDWCTYFVSLGKSNCFINYDAFYEQKSKNTAVTYVTKINETDLLNGKLMVGDVPAFRVLIIPDFLYGVYQRLIDRIGKEGLAKIKKFYEKGGVIFVTGKSGVILEEAELVVKGTYDRSKLLSVDNNERRTSIVGCESTINKTYNKNDDDFEKQMTCLTVNSKMKVGLSTTFLTKTQDRSFKNLINIDSNQKDLSITNTNNFITVGINEEEKKNLPLISYKNNPKEGYIFLMNFNPVLEGGNRNVVFNLLALSMSKELYLTSKVNMALNSTLSDLPIPAGEAGVNLQVKTTIHNLNDEPVSDCTLYVFLPNNFGWTKTPEGCTLQKDKSKLPDSVLQKNIVTSTNDLLVCNITNIGAYEKRDFIVTISVLNYMATQMKYQIQILEPIAVLTSKKKQITLVDYVRVNCEAAPLLRVAANPDPSSFYPVFGEGEYVDNVIKIENKEESNAFEVEYVGLIPIITPLLDGDDQSKTDWALKIYVDYYNDFNFEVPLKSDNATDYVYTAYLQGKGSVIAAEWDSPVLPVKELIDEEMAKKVGDVLKQDVNVTGINKGMITINKTSEVIKQVNYRNSNRFYKLASQRLMVFIDDSTPEGAKTLYGANLEKLTTEWKDPVFGNRAKKEFLFLRNDIYFYDNENYCNPPGVSEKIVFSIDKLVEYKKNKENCAKRRGDITTRVKPIKYGYFDNHDPAHRAKILEPNIYPNELFEYCDLEVIDPTDENAIIKRFGDLDHLRPVHYIIPNVEPDITSAGQIYNFEVKNGKSGYHKTYNSIKFIYLHSATITLDAKRCLYGGKIIVNLAQHKLNSVDDVTVSPDQIAVFKTEYENNKISIFFRRGLMSNEQFGKKLTIGINIENLDTTNYLDLNLEIQEMIYDISIPEREKYESINSYTQTFKYISAFSYPALEMKTKLNRDLLGYETKEPFSRYGTYSQDIEHRYIWGTAETHHETRPGVTGSTGGFSIISNLGTSSIPFIEYMTVGKGQVIPSGTSTARATWKDIWGRTWHQPIRSLFPDVPPIPPPLKNFMMSTTYEILREGKQIYEWPSDEKTQIHLHVKLLNNYPKYFEITRCKENEIQFVPRVLPENHDREYSNSSSVKIEDSAIKNDKTFLRQGGFASYGICFSDEAAFVGGQKVEGELRTQIERAKVCADFTDENMIAQCFKELENITTLHKIKEEDKLKNFTKWNYSPRVERYYPKTYIEDDMWDLTHIDYDDNAMDKAYKYHMDNHLPNYDNTIIKPHNTIAIPIYKGLGYSITYSKDYSMNYHGAKKFGWWSDDLQNRDDTLVAGQTECNQVSVDKKSSINNWVKGKELLGLNGNDKTVEDIINKRNKNIYVCMYNQKRPAFKKGNSIKYATLNVNKNNIVPVLVDLERDDERLTNFNCDKDSYEPDDLRNIEGNLLVTPTSKDYLYFAANLRGQAKEAFNVLMNLENFDRIQYEGMVKVNEGGRFVYWNPANGPNSFLVVDNPVSIINAKRNDIEIINTLFPQNIKTFNSIVYHHYTFRDEKKINQVWPFYSYYANSYGYGDVAISVYVGGIRKSKAVIDIGETTYARIIIFNNCGFDLKMKPDAILSEEIDKKAISAYDLLEKIVHTIRKPTSYNFLEYVVEEKYRKYITIVPSDHNIEVAPEFFDFENINVATIRDGFKGEYNLKITVKENFPPELAGKPIEIKINLLTSYFENFPGTETDLVKTKNYRNYQEIKIPSVYIAIPYPDGQFKGKVLYTSAYAHNLNFNIKLSTDWEILGAKYIDNKTLDDMLNLLQGDEVVDKLNQKWDELDKKNITYTEKVTGLDKEINFTGFNENITQFPIPNGQQPDIAEVSIILKTRVKQIAKGTTYPLKTVSVKYKDWINKTKSSVGLKPFLEASGPWVVLSYSKLLVEKLPNGTYIPSINQELTHEDEGIMRIYFVLSNYGNGNAYNTTYSILLDSKLTYLDCLGINFVQSKINEESHTTELTFDLKSGISQGQSKGGYIYVKYSKLIESYGALTPDELKGLPATLQVANQSETNIRLTNETKSEVVTQVIRTPIVFKYQNNNLLPYLDLIVSGRRSNPTIEIVPKVNTLHNQESGEILKNITKVDKTEYLEEKNRLNQKFQVEYIVKNKVNFDNPEDKPIVLEHENKKHVVLYSLSVRIGSKVTQNKLAYIQEDIGITTIEVVLIIISIVLYALAAFFIWAGVKNLKLINKGGADSVLEKKVISSNLDQLLNE